MINKFLGVQNTEQPERLPLGALVQADNVQITKTGMIEHRPLETKVFTTTNITASYGTDDQTVIFYVDNGSLYAMTGTSVQLLYTSLFNTTPVYWCEESAQLVFFIGGGRAGYIKNKSEVVLLESVNSSVIGCAYHNGMLVLAIDNNGQTFILMSKPYEYDQYYDNESGFFIPNRVTCLRSVSGNLIITTLSNIYVLDVNDNLLRLADFGTPLGKTITVYNNVAYIWTNEGLCRFPEFENLTKDNVSVPPGLQCCINLFEYNGNRYALALTDGGGFSDNSVG